MPQASTSAPPLRAVIFGAEAPLWFLLADVLTELGVTLLDSANAGADVVFAHHSSERGLTELVAAAAAGAPFAQVVVLLPFADDDLERRALQAGAVATFAMGAPLGAFRELIAGLARKPQRRPRAGRT